MTALEQEYKKNKANFDQILLTQKEGRIAVEDYLKQKGVSDYDLNERLKQRVSGITDFRGSLIIDDVWKNIIFELIDEIANQKAGQGQNPPHQTPPFTPPPGNNPPPGQTPPNTPPLPNQNPPNNVDLNQIRKNVKQQINQLLNTKKIYKTDLNFKYQDYENQMDLKNDESQIKSFGLEVMNHINQLVNNQKIKSEEEGISLPIKLAIGGGILLVIITVAVLIIKKIRRK